MTRKPRKQAPDVDVAAYFQDERSMKVSQAKASLGDAADQVYFVYRHGYETANTTKSLGYTEVVIDGERLEHKGDKLCYAPVAMRDQIRNQPAAISKLQCDSAMDPVGNSAFKTRDSEGNSHGLISPNVM